MPRSRRPAVAQGSPTGERITMLLENNPYPQDVRVRSEARSLAAAGHHVTVIAPRGRRQPLIETVEGVRVVRFPSFDGGRLGAAGFVLEYLLACTQLQLLALWQLAAGATILHLHNPPDVLFPVAALYRLAGRKVIFDHHDLFPETIEVKFGSGTVSRLAALCQRLTIMAANHVIATNESYAEISRRHKRSEHVTVVRNAPPAAWTRAAAPVRDGRLEQLRLVYVGAIAAQDGADGLAPVLARLRTGADPLDVRLTIVGDGSGRAHVERCMVEHGVSDCVTFTGWVSPEDVVALVGDADVCVDPAPPTPVNERSTMTKIAEYMSLGKPVVAYELLETARTAADAALLVRRGDVGAFADALSVLASDAELRLRLAGKARRRAVDHLTWERSERALLDAYAALRD